MTLVLIAAPHSSQATFPSDLSVHACGSVLVDDDPVDLLPHKLHPASDCFSQQLRHLHTIAGSRKQALQCVGMLLIEEPRQPVPTHRLTEQGLLVIGVDVLVAG